MVKRSRFISISYDNLYNNVAGRDMVKANTKLVNILINIG